MDDPDRAQHIEEAAREAAIAAATRLAAGPVRESAAAPGSTASFAAVAPAPAPPLREPSPGEATRQRYREPPMEVDGERVCRDCYDPIPTGRLAADPCAVRCIDCQRDKERRDGLHRA